MSSLKNKIVALAAIAALGASVAPAYAKVYNIMVGGVVTPFDCPSSPLGQTLTWVNQNCKQVQRAGNIDRTPLAMRIDKKGVVAGD
jgi:hypothetical protein